MRELADQTDAHVAIIALLRKSGGEGGLDIRGSGDIAAAVDVAVSLKRNKNALEHHRILDAISRHAETPRMLAVALDDGRYQVSEHPTAARSEEQERLALDSITEGPKSYEGHNFARS